MLVTKGGDYGWPSTYYDPIQKARMVGPEYGGDNVKRANLAAAEYRGAGARRSGPIARARRCY